MAVLYVSFYSLKRFEDSFEDKLVEGLQRNKKENTKNSLLYIPKIMIYRVALALATWISYYLSSVCISQLSWSDSSTHHSDAVNYETTRAEAQTTATRQRMSETSWSHSHKSLTRWVTLFTRYERGGSSSQGLSRTTERHRMLLWRHKCPPVGKTKTINRR